MGILLVSGTEDRPQFQKHGWIPAQELFTQEMSRDGKPVQAFAGEGRLLKEVRILAETDTRPVIYFTQSNGELAIGKSGPQDAVDPSQSAARLQGYLEASYSTDVKPLTFASGEANPQVPTDATIVIVAQPQTPLSDAAVGALRRYMGERKGKLIVLSGAVTSLEGRGMTMTGLEGLLAEYNVELGKKFIYTAPVDPRINPVLAYATINRAARNPITESLSQNIRTLPFPFAREVKPMQGSPAMQATTLLQTAPRLETWLEDERLDRVFPAYRALESSEALRVQKQMTTNPRSLMVAVQESGGAGRVVVMGNAMLVSDEVAQSAGGRSSTDVPITFDLVGVSVDWLRDRPPLPAGVQNKVYVEYSVPDPVALNNTRLLYLPLGLGMVIVLGLGAGVWAVRRR
jgi:hypothetical protein